MKSTAGIRKDYIVRINKVVDYVDHNLDKDLTLGHLAEIAFSSPFHFHRIFTAVTGETLNQFVNRKRMERIASNLMQGNDLPLSEIAIDYGFKSSSAFARAFKKYYGISATEFKEKGAIQYSKIRKVERKNGKAELQFEQYVCNVTNIIKWIKMNAQIEVKEMPKLDLVGINHYGDFDKIGEVYERLFRWAGPKGVLNGPFNTVTVYHDDPKVTAIEKVRQTACVTTQNPAKADGEVGPLSVEKGKYAVGRFEIAVHQFEKAWDGMCVWVEENGYKTREGDYYELYHNDHTEHPEQKFILDICIPVE